MDDAASVRYETIGHGYAETRREDPQLRQRIERSLTSCRSVLNVGAGAGSYEPLDRQVIAMEPSDAMAAQRPADLVPALRIPAGPLPMRDRSVDGSMAVLTVHHWGAQQETGIRELRRVTRGPVVVVTYDMSVAVEMWLYRQYFPEAAERDLATFPPVDALVDWLGGDVTVEPVPVARTTPDWTFGSFWAHPERVLDSAARRGTSAFALADAGVVDRVVDAVERDLADGTWDRLNGRLRSLTEYDVGLRLIVAGGTPAS